MKFRHAYTGVRLHIAGAVIAALIVIALITHFILSGSVLDSSWSPACIALICIPCVPAYIGAIRGGKDELAFLRARLPLIGCLAAVIVLAFFMRNDIVAGVCFTLIALLCPLAMRATIRAVRPLAEQLADRRMIARCNRAERLFSVCAIICAISAGVGFFVFKGDVAVCFSLLALALLLAALVIFLVFLARAKRMLRA